MIRIKTAPLLVSLGLRKFDRDLNERIKAYHGWGKQIVQAKVKEVKDKIENGELKGEPKDLIEAVVKNSMKEKK